ncbi:MAG: 3-methyl-2-oxobutanoate hydroxymethyltransferase, partial [Gammaproteobacteria bacterium]
GLQPQSIQELGGYKVQGREEASAQKILKDAKLLEELGVEVMVLECIPTKLGKEISESISIPTIGIGAGNYCDGQVLVSYDMLDINLGRKPKFVKNFMTGNSSIEEAVKLFISEVKSRKFPSADYSYE